jgi:hypothetical protein
LTSSIGGGRPSTRLVDILGFKATIDAARLECQGESAVEELV